jgi:hypothetical protein
MQDFINPPPGNAPVAIHEDGGGLVVKYQQMAAQYALEKRRVEIRGSCRSACVLSLSVPTVCVAPGAVVKAHQAYEQYSKKVRPDITNEMMHSLPVKIKAVLQSNIQTYYTPESTLTYAELRELGIPACTEQRAQVKRVQQPRVSNPNPIQQILSFFTRR